MRFIVDESAGASVASYLRNAGHDVLVVADIRMLQIEVTGSVLQ